MLSESEWMYERWKLAELLRDHPECHDRIKNSPERGSCALLLNLRGRATKDTNAQ
jgi:hypothetical protein